MSIRKVKRNCMDSKEFIDRYKKKFMKSHKQIPIDVYAELYRVYFQVNPQRLNPQGVVEIHQAYNNYCRGELTRNNLEMFCRNGNINHK